MSQITIEPQKRVEVERFECSKKFRRLCLVYIIGIREHLVLINHGSLTINDQG